MRRATASWVGQGQQPGRARTTLFVTVAAAACWAAAAAAVVGMAAAGPLMTDATAAAPGAGRPAAGTSAAASPSANEDHGAAAPGSGKRSHRQPLAGPDLAPPGWPASLDAFKPCLTNRTLPGVRDDASGLTWDPAGAWWLVSDRPLAALKYDMNFSQLLHVIPLGGVHDPEAIAWLPPGRLAVAEEMRDVVLVDVGSLPQRTVLARIKLSSLVRQPNKGVEGMTYNASSGDYLIAQEDYPQAVYRLSADGSYQLLFTGTALGVKDFSDLTCWGPRCEALLILSQSSKRIVMADLQGNLLSSFKVKSLERPEGLALSGDGRLMAVASEPNTVNLYSLDPC